MQQIQTHRHKEPRRKRRSVRRIAAAAAALALVAADYLVSNLSFPLLDASESLAWSGFLLPNRNRMKTDDALFVNVALDRALVPVLDEFGDTAGVRMITDREKLLRFLRIASEAEYRCLFLDVRFERGLESGQDSALYDLMRRLPRFAFSTHRPDGGYELADPSLAAQGAMADYRGNMFNGFSRYEFLQDGRESAALRMYREVGGDGIVRCGPLYRSDGRLVSNMLFLPLPADLDRRIDEKGRVRYPYLGSELLRGYSGQELAERMRGKVVVIGDFDDDLHQTYVGTVPGPMIHYYAFRALESGANRVKLPCLLLMLCVYFLVLADLTAEAGFVSRLAARFQIRSRFGRLLLSFCGWELVLSLLKIVLYLAFGFSFITALPSAVFSVVQLWKELEADAL